MYSCKSKGCQMGQSNGVLLKVVAVLQWSFFYIVIPNGM